MLTLRWEHWVGNHWIFDRGSSRIFSESNGGEGQHLIPAETVRALKLLPYNILYLQSLSRIPSLQYGKSKYQIISINSSIAQGWQKIHLECIYPKTRRKYLEREIKTQLKREVIIQPNDNKQVKQYCNCGNVLYGITLSSSQPWHAPHSNSLKAGCRLGAYMYGVRLELHAIVYMQDTISVMKDKLMSPLRKGTDTSLREHFIHY